MNTKDMHKKLTLLILSLFYFKANESVARVPAPNQTQMLQGQNFNDELRKSKLFSSRQQAYGYNPSDFSTYAEDPNLKKPDIVVQGQPYSYSASPKPAHPSVVPPIAPQEPDVPQNRHQPSSLEGDIPSVGLSNLERPAGAGDQHTIVGGRRKYSPLTDSEKDMQREPYKFSRKVTGLVSKFIKKNKIAHMGYVHTVGRGLNLVDKFDDVLYRRNLNKLYHTREDLLNQLRVPDLKKQFLDVLNKIETKKYDALNELGASDVKMQPKSQDDPSLNQERDRLKVEILNQSLVSNKQSLMAQLEHTNSMIMEYVGKLSIKVRKQARFHQKANYNLKQFDAHISRNKKARSLAKIGLNNIGELDIDKDKEDVLQQHNDYRHSRLHEKVAKAQSSDKKVYDKVLKWQDKKKKSFIRRQNVYNRTN